MWQKAFQGTLIKKSGQETQSGKVVSDDAEFVFFVLSAILRFILLVNLQFPPKGLCQSFERL